MQTSIVAVLSLLAASVMAAPATDNSPCTTVTSFFRPFHLGSPTTTIYATTHTNIHKIQCNGCLLRYHNIAGHGPAVNPAKPTATVTLAATTVQAYKCTEANAVQTEAVVF